jgi:hypothetical protein
MGLAPLQIMDDPRGEPQKEVHVFESFTTDTSGQENCVTIVAVVEGMKQKPRGGMDDQIREWTAYMAAYPCTVDQGCRVADTRARGNKLPKDVAVAMFPRFQPGKFRE